eukprot:8983-Heterococcus_DN1.PRE.1
MYSELHKRVALQVRAAQVKPGVRFSWHLGTGYALRACANAERALLASEVVFRTAHVHAATVR